ncbi:unnamed protein product [Cuscuta europaea]|uniref:Uncharacterized protein n=1 Tax=Cuscuta europaea TaxID=41803 RepID=A0A9P1E923_CUSEU|nr:unnamed protein product [Cuscuta europaea]
MQRQVQRAIWGKCDLGIRGKKICRPGLFKKSMRKYNVVWWAYSFPATVMAIASTKYAQEVKSTEAHILMLILSALSVTVSLILLFCTALNANLLLLRSP